MYEPTRNLDNLFQKNCLKNIIGTHPYPHKMFYEFSQAISSTDLTQKHHSRMQ
jgi:hypothetical protein